MEEPALDCQACGACCAAWVHGDSFVAVTPDDARRLGPRRDLVLADPGTASGLALATRPGADGATTLCAALEGDPAPPRGRVRCAIYEARPAACRAVQPGDAWCRAIRARLGFEAGPLPNPERGWERPDAVTRVDRAEVERRIGPVDVEPEVLSGGLANLNVRVGGGRVLRVHRRDPAVTGKEEALLRRPWRAFVVPRVLARGEDFLLLEEVAHAPLRDDAAHGEAVGRALAEVHAVRFERAGELGPDLTVVAPFADWFGTVREYVLSSLAAAPDLQARARAFLAEREADLRARGGPLVLLHADFKASNLHWATAAGKPLVLDWEFAWAGPALLDVGQLLRWGPSEAFVDGFARGYGPLPDEWRRVAGWLDAINLAGLFAGSPAGTRRAADVRARLERTLA